MSAVCGPLHEMSSINNELDLWIKIFVLNLIMFWTGDSVFCPISIYLRGKRKKKLVQLLI